MSMAFSLREMTPADSPALAELTEYSPDGGRISFRPRFHVPAYDVYLAHNPDMSGVVAENTATGTLVGAARVSFGQLQFEGRVRPFALLSSLMVHPAQRRRGIAAALAQWRIACAEERNGREGVILANIQSGNVASTANARKWATQIGGRVVTSPLSMRARPPKPLRGVEIRPAAEAELGEFASRVNTFYREFNIFRPQTADSVHDLLHHSPLDTPVHHVLVAAIVYGMLAGLFVADEGRMLSLHIETVPAVVRLANLVLKVVPPDNEMRNAQIDFIWHAPGQIEAARALVQYVRWHWRDRAGSVISTFDPRGPLRQVLQVPPWMPATTIGVAMRAPVPMSDTRLIAPML